MSYAPQKLLDLRAYLKIHTGITDNNALGIVSTDNDESYHHGADQRQDKDDYSFDESPRDWNHTTDAASALDIGNFSRLRELSIWLVDECKAGVSDTLDIREIIYSPDGKVVKRWDRLGIRSSGDSSHLTHTHVSWHRDAELKDKISPFARFFEGEDMETEWSKANPLGVDPDGFKRSPLQHERDVFAAVVQGKAPLDGHGNPVGPEAWMVVTLKDIQEAVATIGTPVIDYDLLASKIATLIPVPATPAAIADAVVDEIAS